MKSPTLFRSRPAPLALAVFLAYGLPHAAALAQTPAQPPATSTDTLPQVQVTGSRISRAQAEGPAAVTVLKSEDITRLGFKNVGDALASLTENTGFTQGEDFGNTFTPAANAISLRGLGPNHTLTLVNGRRVADYPTAYEGSVNFVNTANIPAALIDRIEVLNGGASAIYGSDAIAGVINIILKKQVDSTQLNLKLGGTQRGGGENARAQLTGGLESGALSLVYAVELSKRQPIWSRQREFMADTTLTGAAPTVIFGRKDAKSNKYITPDAGACEGAAGLFDGSVKSFTAKSGTYCGSGRGSPSFWTTQTGNQSENFAGLLNYGLNAHTEFYAEALLGFTRTENNTRGPSWTSLSASNGYFVNANSGKLETWSRRFAPEEIGGAEAFNREWKDRAHNLVLGVRGDLQGTSWSYDLGLNSSGYKSKLNRPRLLATVDSFFLGAQQGVNADGVPIYKPDSARLFKALTPAEYASISSSNQSDDRAWTRNFSATANGEVLQLPAGPLRAAVLAEVGSQGFENKADPRLGQGLFYATSEVANVSGDRTRWALGTELNAPLTRELTGTLAGRYDSYKFAGRDTSAFTYNAGLEFRPSKELLVRAQHATSFRAPDMSYIFTAESRGYYASANDYYRCALAGQALDKCEFAGIQPNYVKNGSKDLKSEKGKSWGLGLVWSPSSEFDASLDLWKISISDLVTDLSSDKILRDEADCRTGKQNISSPTCVDAIARVRRNPADAVLRPGEIKEIVVNPINAAVQSTYGFDISSRYSLKTATAGNFVFSAKYTQVQSYKYAQFEGDEASNQVGTRNFSDWPNKLITSVNWRYGAFNTTLAGLRNGKIVSSDGKGWISPKWSFNASSSYELNKSSSVTLIVNNLANSVRKDDSGGWPYYPVGYYLPHGRQFWLEFNHVLGK
ncbi:TonB-dependent receptor plug domain-containing protein [Kinneretia aquatilis]|uniref:TonB-dependent receptor plug domain-containing protein n=1 Tax=Kinneretia aquatilis TaxID=2070761 RepID=UPI0014952D77|nr:TonB-dependent receptor [Paucibacter aquatile]WIW00098.1 TonB-dependent receptor [Paucibacter aquatile]